MQFVVCVVATLGGVLYAILSLLAHELVRFSLFGVEIAHNLKEVVVLLNNTEDAVEGHQVFRVRFIK